MTGSLSFHDSESSGVVGSYGYTGSLSYSGSATKPDSSQFGAVYLGYMYRR